MGFAMVFIGLLGFMSIIITYAFMHSIVLGIVSLCSFLILLGIFFMFDED